jgi:hypothetical protein
MPTANLQHSTLLQAKKNELSFGKNVQVKASTSRIYLTAKEQENNLQPL